VRAALEATARGLGVSDRVTITGVIERDQVAGYISAFDIALQPEVVAYASPLKLFEYMALGRAIVAPDAPNIREIVTDGIDCLLFDPEQPDGLAAALHRLAGDAGLRERLGHGAIAKIAERRLTWRDNAIKVAALAAEGPAEPDMIALRPA
jgi:glycosyltransferase involved in cell wall biosynthesis